MRLLSVKTTILALGLVASFVAFADEDHPCKEIMSACKAQGYYKGGHMKQMGLMEDCMVPVLNGQKMLPGSTFSAETMEQCKTKMGKMMMMMQKHDMMMQNKTAQ